MSKKYVPSFLKDQQVASNNTTSTNASQSASFWPGRAAAAPLGTDNKFAALSDDFAMKKPIVNTSRPAMEAPKLAPMTLASATSNGAVPMAGAGGASGSKKSFASKFAEQVKIANDPNYKPPPKPVNFESEDDFPSLGGPAKKPANVVIKPELATAPTGSKFADMAKGWAKQKEEEAEKALKKAAREEQLRREAELMRSMPIMGGLRRRRYDDDDDDEEDYNPNYDESSLGDDDSYEVPEGDGEPSDEDDENQGEFNSDLGWDGRKRGDLY